MNVNPADFLISLKGKPYLPVAGRIAIIRAENKPYSIKTTPLQIDMEAGFAIFQAEIWLDGVLLATGTKQESRKDFPDFLEKAETGAVGRACAMAGFGTIYALQDFDEGERLADAPVTVSPKAQPKAAPPAPVDDVRVVGRKFADALAFLEGDAVSPVRLREVHRILTGSDERTVESLTRALDMVTKCPDVQDLDAMLTRMGKGADAPF